MNPLYLFLSLAIAIRMTEWALVILNYRYASCPNRQQDAARTLGLTDEQIHKIQAYFKETTLFGLLTSAVSTLGMVWFLWAGGLTYIEAAALTFSQWVGGQDIITGIGVFGLLWLILTVIDLPLSYYSTFVIEQRYGFNTSSKRLFWKDQSLGILMTVIILFPCLAVLMWIIHSFEMWWVIAWGFNFMVMLTAMWLHPTLIAPLFNTFRPITDGGQNTELAESIQKLAKQIDFPLDDIQQKDASIRSTHGNAYFTGLFKKKRIVFFDTLLKLLDHRETVAVLAHELGHYKLHHIRNHLILQFFLTGAVFGLLWLIVDHPDLATSFGFAESSAYASLFFVFIFSSSIINRIQFPLMKVLSRKNEYAADEFAAKITPVKDLESALVKLTADSHLNPVKHPLYSAFYESHPPIIQRLAALKSLSAS